MSAVAANRFTIAALPQTVSVEFRHQMVKDGEETQSATVMLSRDDAQALADTLSKLLAGAQQ